VGFDRFLLPASEEQSAPSVDHGSRSYGTKAMENDSDDISDGEVEDAIQDGSNGKRYDEIADRFEKLLQKWSSNTPQFLERLQVTLNPSIVCRVLRKSIKSAAAWKFFRWAKAQEGFQHDVYTYTAMIEQFGKAKNYAAIETVVADMREEGCKMSVVTFTALMHWYNKAKNIKFVRKTWQQMQEENCRPNEITYTTYIDALVKAGCHLEALDAYKQMIEAGCKPNIFTMTVLIHSLTETGKLDGACELFAKLKSIQCRPSHVTYSLLIRAHAKAGSLEKAMFFYKSMVEAGMALPPAVRNLLLTALREGGKEVEANQLMAELETSSTTSSSASVGQQPKKSKARSGSSVPLKVGLPKPEKLAALICKWNTDTAKALEVVKLKLRHPYVLNVLTLLSKEPDAAWWFFEWLRAQEGYKHTKYAYTKMLDIIAKHQNIELLRTVLSEVEREGKANTVAYNTLIQCYSQNKHTDAALQVFNRMKEIGCEPNEYTYTMLIDLVSRTKNHHEAMKFYGQMIHANCKPTVNTYTVIMHSLARSGKVNAANTLFEKLPSLGFPPTAVTYTVLIQAFLKERNIDKAMELYERMREEALTPSRVSVKILAKGLRFAGRHDEAESLTNSIPYLQEESNRTESSESKEAEKLVSNIVTRHFRAPAG
jgi:pentatricopeptide repeat protein